MKFANPNFLYALFALAIPIIIHLFNFRKYKTLYFSNVRFLKEVKQQTQSKSQLKHLLVLLSRLLALAFLVFAFAQPFIPSHNKLSEFNKTSVSIYIDNSFSMDAESEKGRLIETAKNLGTKIIDFYKPSDKFQLLTNDFLGKHQHLVNKQMFVNEVQEVKTTPSYKTVSQIVERQKSALVDENEANKKIFIISDFQKNNCDFEKLSADSNLSINLLPLKRNPTRNIYIDSCWFESPVRQLNSQEKLHVRIVNNTDEDYTNVPLKLFINGRQKALASININKNGQADSVLYFTNTETGFQQAKLEITDYPITYDDNLYFSYEVSSFVNVLCLFENDSNKSMHSLFNNDDFVHFEQRNIKQLDYTQLRFQNLIILSEIEQLSSGLNQELIKFVRNGGSLTIIPSLTGNIENYNSILQSFNGPQVVGLDTNDYNASELNLQDFHYANVFESLPKNMNYPIIKQHIKINSNTSPNTTSLLKLRNDDDLLIRTNFDGGMVYFITTGVTKLSGNFTRHSLFVPSFYKMAVNSLRSNPLYYTMGSALPITVPIQIPGNDQVISLKSNSQNIEYIPEQRKVTKGIQIKISDQLGTDGGYYITLKDSIVGSIAFNFNRKESNLAQYQYGELQQLLNDQGLSNFRIVNPNEETIENTLATISEGQSLWKYCILFVLIFLGLEILLLKFWK